MTKNVLEVTVRGEWGTIDTEIVLHNETNRVVHIIAEGNHKQGVTRLELVPCPSDKTHGTSVLLNKDVP